MKTYKEPIRILFICHGNILTEAEKSKENQRFFDSESPLLHHDYTISEKISILVRARYDRALK